VIPARDLAVIMAISGGTSLVVAVVGLWLLGVVRQRSLQVSAVLIALVPVAAVLAGALTSGAAMFFSGHDLRVLVVVAVTAGSVAVATALVLGRRVAAGSRSLSSATAGLSDGTYQSPRIPLPAELAALDRQLAELSTRLENSRQRERTLELSRRELVAWVSHDLRTPLAGIRAMAEALEDGIIDDAATIDRYHERIRQEADRLSAMVDDLFELSRINASALNLVLQEVLVADVLSDAVATAQPTAAAKGVTVIGELPRGTPRVAASVPELNRVMGNLVANAVRHTPTGGQVRVTCAAEEGEVIIGVEDTCGGIPPEDLPRLFDVAFRGSAARTPGGGGGAGLGLAIARGLVEAHGGTVEITNHRAGCCAGVRLPALDDETVGASGAVRLKPRHDEPRPDCL
jgi:signal transduction histidine kinase